MNVFGRNRGPLDASVLLGPLTTLAESADEQMAYLAGRATLPDRSDLDVVQELFEEFSDAVELGGRAIVKSPGARAAIFAIDDALRGRTLGTGIADLATDAGWENIRELAESASAALRRDGLVPDEVAYRLLPTRFADILEPVYGPREEWLAIVLTQAELDWFTAAWEQQIPKEFGFRNVTVEIVQQAARSVYANFPEVLDALGLR
jgi:hypothetical protein